MTEALLVNQICGSLSVVPCDLQANYTLPLPLNGRVDSCCTLLRDDNPGV